VWDTEADFPLSPIRLNGSIAFGGSIPIAQPLLTRMARELGEYFARVTLNLAPTKRPLTALNSSNRQRRIMGWRQKSHHVCLDAGTLLPAPVTFASNVLPLFHHTWAGACRVRLMGHHWLAPWVHGVPSSTGPVPSEMRTRRLDVCMVGEGGHVSMTGQEMIWRFERKLPVIFIVSSNAHLRADSQQTPR